MPIVNFWSGFNRPWRFLHVPLSNAFVSFELHPLLLPTHPSTSLPFHYHLPHQFHYSKKTYPYQSTDATLRELQIGQTQLDKSKQIPLDQITPMRLWNRTKISFLKIGGKGKSTNKNLKTRCADQSNLASFISHFRWSQTLDTFYFPFSCFLLSFTSEA